MSFNSSSDIPQKTIHDFGEQWSHFHEDSGYYASGQFLKDRLGPLMDLAYFKDKRVVEIGSGTGRIVHMVLEAGPAHVWAVEPSSASNLIRQKFGTDSRITIVQEPGERLPRDLQADIVISLGVIHHIPNPLPTLQAAYEALKPGGRCVIWVYGLEGNQVYVAAVRCLRWLTTRLSHQALKRWSVSLASVCRVYGRMGRLIHLPLQSYIQDVFLRLTPEQQTLVVYDQLNPAYARYYRKQEVEVLMNAAGFSNTRLYHYQNYSWTVLAEKEYQVERNG